MQVTLPAADVVCIYGLPNHELYLELKEWLDENQNHFLVVLEDDERALIGQSGGHERIRLCYVENDETFKEIAWELVFLQFEYLRTPGNSSKKPEKMELFFSKMAFFQQGVHLVASDFQNRGLDLLGNFLENGSRLAQARKGQALFGEFSGIPAIICGAGASLEIAAPWLKELKDKALLFAGGTTLSSLAKFGICPHFGGAVDPHPPSARFFQHQSFDIPLFFQTRASSQLLKHMHGPLLWIPGSQNDLLEEEKFDGGWNVSTFLTAVAYYLGCNPIILVGVDLVQKGEKSYAGDFDRVEEGELIWLKEDLYTRRDWLFAADWLSDFAKEHRDREWINTSDGLELKGFKKGHLDNFPLEKKSDLTALIKSKIEIIAQGIVPPIQSEEIEQSLSKVASICSDILDLLEKLFPSSIEKSGEYALLELEIEKEKAYVKFLKPIWDVWKHVFARQIPKDIPAEYGIGLNQWLFIKGICDEARKI